MLLNDSWNNPDHRIGFISKNFLKSNFTHGKLSQFQFFWIQLNFHRCWSFYFDTIPWDKLLKFLNVFKIRNPNLKEKIKYVKNPPNKSHQPKKSSSLIPSRSFLHIKALETSSHSTSSGKIEYDILQSIHTHVCMWHLTGSNIIIII